ncbi:hypothetical protein [Paenarthrobacter sp. NPDC018779]|uniref:hypothetical protein n=1 Tax=Paenarthrobacter sp. NPDC018779 TaxID=3364375 RepID=UPI0037C8E15B
MGPAFRPNQPTKSAERAQQRTQPRHDHHATAHSPATAHTSAAAHTPATTHTPAPAQSGAWPELAPRPILPPANPANAASPVAQAMARQTRLALEQEAV